LYAQGQVFGVVHSGSGRRGALADKNRVARNARAASQLVPFVAIATACHGFFLVPLDFIPVPLG
jgi:uncharacterized membrane protein YfbV (UPF0208 family)